jgi:hypothetical protein
MRRLEILHPALDGIGVGDVHSTLERLRVLKATNDEAIKLAAPLPRL